MGEMKKRDDSKAMLGLLFGCSIALIIGAFCAGDWGDLIPGLLRICKSPMQLTMDKFLLGGIGGAFLNTGLVGLECCALLYFSKANCNGLTFAAFWLVVGFGTYGINIWNVLPFMFGGFVYSRIKKVPFGSVANFALFSTALAPFASELVLRYPNTEVSGFSWIGLLGAVILGILVGCVMPALCQHSPNFHKGYNLYNAGPAAGFLAFLIYCILFRTPGIEVPTNTNLGDGNRLFVSIFFLILFLLCILAGYLLDHNCFKDYKKIWKSDGFKTDFTVSAGTPAAFVNIGVYGLFILLYYLLVCGMTIQDGSLVFTGAKFTGPTMGAIMCMLAFAAHGATPRLVFPIQIGYALASLLPFLTFAHGAVDTHNWMLTSQGMLIGLCYASGLAPFTGRYGFLAGVVAGALHAIMVTSVPLMHGGFCLYNGGFTAGIVAFLLIPVLECFFKTKEERSLYKKKGI